MPSTPREVLEGSASGERAVEQLPRDERLYATLVNSLGGIVWEADGETFQFTFVSPQAEQILGYPVERWLQEPDFWRDHTHPEDRDWCAAYCMDATAHRRDHEFDYRMTAADGREVWLHDVVSIAPQPDGSVRLRGIMVDITARKLAEEQLRATSEQLRALTASLSSAREEEGVRIAREIHDELGSALTSLRWDLEEMDKTLAEGSDPARLPALRAKIGAMTKLIDTTVNSVRRISSELRPSVLDDLGLAAAIEWHAEQFEARTGIVCRCDCPPEEVELTREQSTAIFRIFQEALTNVLRHARATRVHITLERDEGDIVLSVRDDGRGITEGEKRGRQTLGLLGMRERAHLVGGEVNVAGVEGAGTTVVVRVPLARARGVES